MEDLAQGARTKALMIGHDDTAIRITSAENHVRTLLALEDEAHAFERLSQGSTGEIGGRFIYRVPVRSSTYSRESSAGTGSPAARQSST